MNSNDNLSVIIEQMGRLVQGQDKLNARITELIVQLGGLTQNLTHAEARVNDLEIEFKRNSSQLSDQSYEIRTVSDTVERLLDVSQKIDDLPARLMAVENHIQQQKNGYARLLDKLLMPLLVLAFSGFMMFQLSQLKEPHESNTNSSQFRD